MRVVLMPILGLVAMGATGENPEAAISTHSGFAVSPEKAQELIDRSIRQDLSALVDNIDQEGDDCRDRITQAREATGQSPLILDREPASPEKPHAIYAVDRRQDGCSVMVMMGDPDDIRPLPGPMEGPLQVIPAYGEPDQ